MPIVYDHAQGTVSSFSAIVRKETYSDAAKEPSIPTGEESADEDEGDQVQSDVLKGNRQQVFEREPSSRGGVRQLTQESNEE